MVSALPLRALGHFGTVSPGQHVCRQIRLLFDKVPCILRTLAELVAYDFVHGDQLSLLQVIENFGIRMCSSPLYCLKLFSRRVGYRFPLEQAISYIF